MKDHPCISVVVPIYNVEKYLPRCVDSILAQDYDNLELILVDDGSPDNCPRILDDYAKADSRVRVLHCENGGVSAARNRGAQAASGEWICYVDADDYVAPRYLTSLYQAAKEFDAPMSVCGTQYVDDKGAALPPYVKEWRGVLSAGESLTEMFYQRMFFASPCCKLLPVEIARAYPFPPGRYEDLAITYRWIDAAGRVAVDTRPGYFYVQHAESFMGRGFGQERFTLLDVSDEGYEFVRQQYPDVLPAARARRFSAYCQVLLAMPKDAETYREQRQRILTVMGLDAPGVSRDKNCRKKDRVAAMLFRLTGETGLRAAWRLKRG